MKTIKTLLLILITILIFTACKKDESSNLWTISGEVRMQDAYTPAITSPLEGINVYLLKAPFTIDSATSFFTESDIMAITQTNIDGVYNFNQLQVGDYLIMPVDTIMNYQFDWSESPDSISLKSENTQKDYTVNFTTSQPIIENKTEFFEVTFFHSGDNSFLKRVEIFRECRVRFGCGSWWTEPCDWYWSSLWPWQKENDINWENTADPTILPFPETSFRDAADATNPVYQYTNTFHFKFYTGVPEHSSDEIIDHHADNHIYTYTYSFVLIENIWYDSMYKRDFKVHWIDINNVEVSTTSFGNR